MKTLKYSEIYIIACQNPDFFLIDGIQPYESGFDLEKRLFPNLKKKIYAQDYEYIKKLDGGNAKKVGKIPKDS